MSRRFLSKQGKGKTKKGEKMNDAMFGKTLIKDMADDHLRNAIRRVKQSIGANRGLLKHKEFQSAEAQEGLNLCQSGNIATLASLEAEQARREYDKLDDIIPY